MSIYKNFRIPYYNVFEDRNLTDIPRAIEEAYEFEEYIAVWISVFTAIEAIVTQLFKYKCEPNDFTSSSGAFICLHFTKLSMRWLDVKLFSWIYTNYAIIRLPSNSIWVFLLQFILIDFTFYWWHRAAHEVNIFWAVHQVHHNSEYFTFSTAIRKGFFDMHVTTFFYLPFVFFFQPQLLIVHYVSNLTYQFFIHTEIIRHMGPLENILNTPSHHRVHHGRNRYCIDKNYAGIFIIWDKLFGTFEPERKNEQLVYGLVHNIRTFNQFYIQSHHFQEIFFKFINMKTVCDKLRAIFYGPGWSPGTHRLGNNEDIPDVDYSVQVYNPPMSEWLKHYARLHAIINFLMHLYFLGKYKTMSTGLFICYVIFSLYGVHCTSTLFDLKPYAKCFELSRCVLLCTWLFLIHDIYIYLLYSCRLVLVLSIFYWLIEICRPKKHIKTS